MNIFRVILKIFLGIFGPFILIGLGCLVVGLGITYSIEIIAWAGLALVGAGIFWGMLLYWYVSGQ